MSVKKIFFEKETLTRERGFIEVETDYIQTYHMFSKISASINSATTFKLLFFLLANKTNNENGIDVSSIAFKEFNDHLLTNCGKSCQITQRTYTNCIKDLVLSGALTKVQKGHYYANPQLFWNSSTEKRKEFILSEQEKLKLE